MSDIREALGPLCWKKYRQCLLEGSMKGIGIKPLQSSTKCWTWFPFGNMSIINNKLKKRKLVLGSICVEKPHPYHVPQEKAIFYTISGAEDKWGPRWKNSPIKIQLEKLEALWVLLHNRMIYTDSAPYSRECPRSRVQTTSFANQPITFLRMVVKDQWIKSSRRKKSPNFQIKPSCGCSWVAHP